MRWLGGASLGSLALVSAAATLGVSLAGPAHAVTVNPAQTNTYFLSNNKNPITFGSGTNVDTSTTYGPAVQGNSTYNWR